MSLLAKALQEKPAAAPAAEAAPASEPVRLELVVVDVSQL